MCLSSLYWHLPFSHHICKGLTWRENRHSRVEHFSNHNLVSFGYSLDNSLGSETCWTHKMDLSCNSVDYLQSSSPPLAKFPVLSVSSGTGPSNSCVFVSFFSVLSCLGKRGCVLLEMIIIQIIILGQCSRIFVQVVLYFPLFKPSELYIESSVGTYWVAMFWWF